MQRVVTILIFTNGKDNYSLFIFFFLKNVKKRLEEKSPAKKLKPAKKPEEKAKKPEELS